jgi:cytochrome P450
MMLYLSNHPELAKGMLISINKQARLERKEFIAPLKEWARIQTPAIGMNRLIKEDIIKGNSFDGSRQTLA